MGDDANPGTIEQSQQTVQDGVDELSQQGKVNTLYFRGGIHGPTHALNTENDSDWIEGAGKPVITIPEISTATIRDGSI